MLGEQGHEVWIGDAANIRASSERKQKTDRRDALLLMQRLVEAAQSAVRHEPELRRAYRRLAQRKCRALAKVAMARKLAVRLYWMLRSKRDYAQRVQGSHAG